MTMNNRCRILLQDPHCTWFRSESEKRQLSVHARGYAFLGNDYYDGQSLANMVDQSLSTADQDGHVGTLKDLVPRLNGAWGLVVDWGGKHVLAAVDRCRSIPLFYALTNLGYVIATSAEDIAHEVRNPEISIVSAAEYMLSGYVSGRDTLYKGIYQVQAAELVEFKESKGEPIHKCQFYFRYFGDEPEERTQQQFEEKLECILEDVFTRHAKVLKDRPLVLPLSAGYDSRLIAWMLRKNGVEDVLCYTYGGASNPQREIARRVALELGYRWRFIEYDATTWANCMDSSEMRGYLTYAFRGTSSPHIQDFPAVRCIASTERFKSRPVFLPGHVGGAWASDFVLTHLDKRALHPPSEYHSHYCCINGSPIVSAIAYRHLNLWPVAARLWQSGPLAEVAQKIQRSIREYEGSRGEGMQFVEWVLRSRTATWIVNSCRCFEYFGGDFALLLGDYAIIDFFRKLPYNFLLDRSLYHLTAQRILHDRRCMARDVPVRSGGTPPPKFKRWAIDKVVDFGIYKPLDRLRRIYRPRKNLYAESWFTKGKRPEEVTIKEAIASHGNFEALPNELQVIVSPLLNKPVYSVQCNSLLAVVGLIDYYSGLRQTKKKDTGAYLLTSSS